MFVFGIKWLTRICIQDTKTNFLEKLGWEKLYCLWEVQRSIKLIRDQWYCDSSNEKYQRVKRLAVGRSSLHYRAEHSKFLQSCLHKFLETFKHFHGTCLHTTNRNSSSFGINAFSSLWHVFRREWERGRADAVEWRRLDGTVYWILLVSLLDSAIRGSGTIVHGLMEHWSTGVPERMSFLTP